MQDQNQNTNTPQTIGVNSGPLVSTGYDSDRDPFADSEALSSQSGAPQFPAVFRRATLLNRLLKRVDVILLSLLIVGALGLVLSGIVHKHSQSVNNGIAAEFGEVKLPLSQFVSTENGIKLDAGSVVINGALKLNQGVVVTPSVQPNAPSAGQLYYDQNTHQLAYFNGTAFVPLSANGQVVQTLGGLSGQVTLGGGLSVVGNQLVSTNNGLTSFGGRTGAIAVGAGLNLVGSTLQNSGVVGLTAGTNISLTNNNGVYTVSNTGAGTGTVTSGGGTNGTLPLFTGAQNVENSIVTQAAGAITVTGNLNVSGGLVLGSAVTVPNGGTGAASLTANGVLLGNGSAAISSLAAGGGGLCLLSTVGAPAWSACPGGGAVASLNGLTGALSVANATAAGSTITVNDAGIGTKGLASFDGTNFSVTAGAVNTIQDIATGSTPTFAGVNTNSITPSAALSVGVSGQTLTLQGGAATTLKATAGGSTTTIDFTSPTANTTLHFPALPLGSYTICTTVGNCAGSGGGVTGSGTNNQIVKFTSTGSTIGDSSLSDTGAVVTTTGDLVIQGGDVTVGVADSQTGTIKFAHSGSGFFGSLMQGALTADHTYTLPNATGTVCLDSGNCLGGGGGGANVSLSNLTSVAINATLLPLSAGIISIGSGTLPFGDLYLAGTSATPGTNNFKITGASTSGTRIITLPDAGGTVCLQGAAACNFAATSGNGNYIQNQNGADQAADFRVNGTGRANTSLLTPLLDTASGVALAIGTNNATAINLNQTTAIAAGKSLTVGQDITLQAANSSISNAQTTTHGESFGAGATTANDAAAFGFNAAALANSVAIGSGAATTATSGIAIGNGATAASQFAIALGRGATTTAANQFMIGSSTGAISQVVIGNGFSNAAPSDVVIQGTGGSGTDVAGANLAISSGVGTGLGAGGNINFKVATPAGSTGSSANLAQTVASLSGVNGAAVFKNVVNGAAAFDVQTQGAASVFTVNTAAPGVTISGSSTIATLAASGITLGSAALNTPVTIDSGTAAVNIGTGAQNRSTNLGTGAAVQTVAVGSTNSTSTTTIQGGNSAGAVSIQAAASGTISIGTTNANTITVGSAASAAAITLGQSTVTNTINIGNATTAAGNIQTINIGTSATGTGKAAITIGNTNDGSSLILQAGTGNVTLSTNSASASVIAKSGTNGVGAFEVLDSGNNAYLTVNTSATNPGTYLTGTGTGGGGSRLYFGPVGDTQVYIGEGGAGDSDSMELYASTKYDFYAGTGHDEVLRLDQNGLAKINSVNDANGGFQVNDSSANQLFFVDPKPGAPAVHIGNYFDDSTGTLLILDHKSVSAADPTGVLGGMYYSLERDEFRCYEAGTWHSCLGVPKPNTRRWTYITYPGSGSSFDLNGDIVGLNISNAVPATTSEPGMLDFPTAGTINSASSTEGNLNYNTSNNPDWQSYVDITNNTSVRVWAGLTDQQAAVMAAGSNPAGNYAAFRFDTGLDTHYQCITKDGTTQTIVDSGTSPGTIGHKLEVILVNGTEAEFKIDGANVCTSTTHLPSSATLTRAVDTITTLTSAIRSISVGWIYVESDK